MTRNKISWALAGIALVLALSGCRTDGGDPEPSVTAPPTAAVISVAKTAATQVSVDFTLTNTPAFAAGSVWKVYAAWYNPKT